LKLKPYLTTFTEAGCDEAGRGCLAGPVVAAAVILPKGYTNKRLNDSKKVSKKLRNELRIDIEKKAISIIHQSGDKHHDELVKNYEQFSLKVEIKKFIHDMDKKYEWADLIIARSGALTVSEICEAGIASILLPYPYAVDNHQLFNAKIIKNKKGGFIILQKNMMVELKSMLTNITRKECLIMAKNVKNKKRQNAAIDIFNYCIKVLGYEK
jgi:UDP-N-acetylglucosamine--N-acetylmuramyl-(pentapeptide) pyrophosphoryl-undecaprenol N-acetylglucosamine transferase